MGLLRWLFQAFHPAPLPTLAGDGKFRLDVVGESHYQAALERICGGRTEEGADLVVAAVLAPEPSNPKDKNAVRVEIAGKTVGYLARDDARTYRERMEAGSLPRGRVGCKARIRGGWDRGKADQGHFGVRLDVVLGSGPEKGRRRR